MAIDTTVPGSDGWYLQQLYGKLRSQQKKCEELHKRYIGDPPLPPMNDNQREAVKWFVSKARTNFERLIVKAVLDRLRIRGIRTAVDADEGGDAEAMELLEGSRYKLWMTDGIKMALSMGRGFVMVGKDDRGKLLVTAEDPRHCAVITDPADPLRVEAAIKLIFNPTTQEDIAYLFRRDGNQVVMRIAKRKRYVSTAAAAWRHFDANAFDWATVPSQNDPNTQVQDYLPEWLQGTEDREPLLPIVELPNEDGMAEFEPHLEILDRITQQILQRMTIATIQAFKQRAMKGLPQSDPKTGEKIDYDSIFIAEPGAIWNIPQSVEIWESGAVDLQPILLSIRDDIKDLAAVSGTPLYTVTPDVANGSAEGASLQREQLTFKVVHRQDLLEIRLARIAELIFRTTGDETRAAQPDKIKIMWTPADRPSMSERANAIAQTKGVIPRYYQMTEIWGMDPATADRAMTELQKDMVQDQAMAAAAGGGPGGQPQQPQLKPNTRVQSTRPTGLPDVTKELPVVT